ncbi:MAG: hypothetical protein NVS2B8_04770 [Vulcanimicrobiaceae bacterium]
MAAYSPTSIPRALLIEPQALVAPYFVATLAAAGYAVVQADEGVSAASLRQTAPDIVVIDAVHLDEPLALLRALHREVPAARIVVYARALDTMWAALAASLGADVVIGPRACERDFLAAVEWTTPPAA